MLPFAKSLLYPVLASTAWMAAAGAQVTLHTFNGLAANDELGFCVAVVDDFDGDGAPDMAVGARGVNVLGPDTGRVYVYSGQSGALIRTHDGLAAGGEFGFSLAAIGDLNGDGVGELVVGSPYAPGGGTVRVFSGANGNQIYALSGGVPNARFGQSLGVADDLDGDAVPDILVGSPGFNPGSAVSSGRAQAFSGATGALLHTVTNNAVASNDEFGIRITGLGDLTGDGRSEFLVGCFLDDTGSHINNGSARMFSGADGAAIAQFVGDSTGWVFGRSVANLGDLNGDGLAEFAIGGSGNGNGVPGNFLGIVRVYSGAAGFPVLFSMTGIYDAAFGAEIAVAGDWNGDGTNDIALGSYNGDLNGTNSGFVRIYSGVDGAQLEQIIGGAAGDTLGYTLSGGDVNLDGNPDLMMGAFAVDGVGTNSGQVLVVTQSVSPGSGTLELVLPSCPGDASAEPGLQIAVELRASGLRGGGATGYYAALSYDMGVLAYRGDLSSYTANPYSLHISPLLQADDGTLDLDGSVPFGGTSSSADALLATLVFDVLVNCGPVAAPVVFDALALFPSEFSLDGLPVATNLTGFGPVTFDFTPPVLSNVPADIVQASDASLTDACAGAIVTFDLPDATDTCDAAPLVVCTPASGSLFPIGTTTVVCTATDACGNQSVSEFDVTVTPTNLLAVDVELAGVFTPVSRCIYFLVDGCIGTSAVVAFADHDGDPLTAVRGTGVFELPCGLYDSDSICAKDEQHTKWAVSMLGIDGAVYSSLAPIVLNGGDTDNDGYIDINDVTLFLGQFGQLPHPGGCGWDGTRDADFDNNGAIGSSDYPFLTEGWLTTSTCNCAALFGRRAAGVQPEAARVRAVTGLQRSADLNRDGWVDVLDVEELETRHGLSGELSRRMRGQ